MTPRIVSNGAIRASLLFLIIGGFFYLGSCRKTDKSGRTNMATKEDVPEWVMEKIRNTPPSFMVPVNMESKAVFLDKQGHERAANYWRDMKASGRIMDIPCDPFEDDFDDNVFWFNYIQVVFAGMAGFEVQSEFIISTGFNILANAPGDITKKTSGRVRVKDRVSQTILYNYTDLPMTITNLGADPANGEKTRYKLVFKTPLINDPNINILDVFFDVRPIVYTDCDEVIITTSNWQSAPFGVIATNVCSRTDNVYIQPMGTGVVSIAGCVAGTSYPSGVAVPHEQQVQYFDGVSWITIPFPLNSCTQTTNLIPFDAWMRTVPSGNVKFRWRNMKHNNNNCAPNFTQECTGPFYEKTIAVP